MEMEREHNTDAVILMEPRPVNHLKSKYRTLRRQVFFIQSVSLLLCGVCCLLTVFHYHKHTCPGNSTENPPSHEKQVSEGRDPSFTRLTVKPHKSFGPNGYVPWTPALSQPQNKIKHFTLDEDGISLIVNITGTYKVCLQITYKGPKTGELQLKHEIKHVTDKYPNRALVLLTNTETVNFTSTTWRKSLFSGDIFHLDKGDKLKLWSDALSSIDVSGAHLEQKNFFVLYPQFST